ncbi:hypothetical protein JCM19274_5228 [Algibacter lectus]|uniref:Uncharacterized protein n=1 Tax=Algibacter lectus TaxID=221126 RepID=A0A090WKE5_9FLAO|nr:hypothetical protein [Algibacter lectus]GAL77515.1 hypothetical protein JCM19274_5228 [Algibacter lectus]
MDFSTIVIYLGFTLAAYSVIGNDTIQTLGTFLSSNERKKWWVLWLYAGGILTFTLIYGYITHDGDVSYGRLEKYPMPNPPFSWYYILPPIILMILTRTGIPVSTSFLILTFFNQKNFNRYGFKIRFWLCGFFCCRHYFVFGHIQSTREKIYRKPNYSKRKPNMDRFTMGVLPVFYGRNGLFRILPIFMFTYQDNSNYGS